MEFLNQIELRGIVGNVRINKVYNTKCANISLLTEYSYHSKDGGLVIDTVWHNVTAFESEKCKDLESITKGSKLFVKGRVKYRRYIGSDGNERTICEINAQEIQILQ